METVEELEMTALQETERDDLAMTAVKEMETAELALAGLPMAELDEQEAALERTRETVGRRWTVEELPQQETLVGAKRFAYM